MNDSNDIAPLVINSPTNTIDGIHVYDQKDYNQWFETEYNNNTEPWEYSHRAAELYRHQYSVQKILKYKPAPEMLLELGASKGLMTKQLIPFCNKIYAADISLTALKACKQRCDVEAKKYGCQMDYFLTTIPNLPFADESFDVVTICDGLAGWYLADDQRRLALIDVNRVLKKGGIAILTDCLMPERNKGEFDAYKSLVQQSPLSIKQVSYLYDKPWYMMESVFKKIGLERKASKILANISLAKILNKIGGIFGRKASRHIIVIVRRD
jgi:ubiquinone/menaquinone biosynthesis C-methylase UbiE